MKAAVYVAPGTIEIQDYPPTECGDGLILRTRAAGVCGTDLKAFRGMRPGFEPPMVLGHEFAGDVLETAIPGYELGERIGAAPYAGCGECAACLSEREELCRAKVFMSGGSFAEEVRLPAALVRKTAWKLPADLSYEEAALAEPLACCILALRACRWQAGWTVLIAGAGFMGLLHLLLAKTWGARTILVSEPDTGRRQRAQVLGARVFDPSTGGDLGAWARAETEGQGPDVVVAAVGSAEVVQSVYDCAAPGGVVHVFGGLPQDAKLSLSAYNVHYREVSLVGTSGFRSVDYRLAAQLVARRAVDVRSLITARLPLSEARTALAHAGDLDSLKVILLP